MKYTFCPILLEKLEYPRTNGQSKAGVSNLEIPAHYYNTYAREDYLLSDRLNLLPGYCFAWAYCIARRAQLRKSSSLSRHGISFDVPPPPELAATLVAPSSPARKTRRPLSKTSLNPNRSLDKNLSFSNDRFGFIEWLLLYCRTG